MPQPRSRLIGLLLAGILLTAAISALTGSNAPVLFWFVVVGVGLMFAIAREWLIVHKPFRSKGKPHRIPILLIGSYPYVAAMVFMAIFSYCAVKVLFEQTLSPFELRTLGKIAVFCVASIFIGGFVLQLWLIGTGWLRGRDQRPTGDRRKRRRL